MFCPKCLSENADTSKFCNNCGLSFVPVEQPGFSATKTLETPVPKIDKGTLIAGKYRILEEIGRGGMGIVYRAEDIKLKRTVALKFLPHQWISDAESRERFIHEARAASALDHNNICTIHEIEETEDGRMYIAMAFYEGESLREKIKREPLKAEEAVAIAIPRWPWEWQKPTKKGSSTGISSQLISLLPQMVLPRSWILAWPSWPAR